MQDATAAITYNNYSDGKPQDINADDGKRWNLLYYSKSEDAGSPLCVNSEGEVFTRTVDAVSSPDGYEPVTCFGERAVANLNSYVRKKETKSIYLHYITKELISGEEGAEKQEEEEEEDTDGKKSVDPKESETITVEGGTPVERKKGEKYLADLMISTEKTESAVKAAITKKKGFKGYPDCTGL